jgi:hypothetical protein
MALKRLVRQIWTLFKKDLTIVVWRSWFSTFLRAVALPIAYMFFIAYVRNFFLPPSEYGIASSYNPIRDITTEVFNSSISLGGRNRVVFVNEGSAGGQIDTLIERLAIRLSDAGADVHRISDENELFDLCPSTLTGLSPCYGAVSFESSPTEGGVWAYTARADFGLGLLTLHPRDRLLHLLQGCASTHMNSAKATSIQKLSLSGTCHVSLS